MTHDGGRLGRVLRSTAVRTVFVALAVAGALFAVVRHAADIGAALSGLPVWLVAVAGVLGTAFMGVTMLSWHALLRDSGSRLTVSRAATMFFVAQLGKYLPGGVWNIAAVAEMGADDQIPRRRSVSVMLVATLISVVTALALAALAAPLAPDELVASYGWLAWGVPFLAILLAPPVLNRFISVSLRTLRRPPLDEPITGRGVSRAAAWSLVAWVLAGAHVWCLAIAVGLEASPRTLALATGGYALAWVAGFLFVVSPAGLGVRELVLGAVLASELDTGQVVVVVLLSRVLLTVADLLLGVAALSGRRRQARLSP